jgi:hypothetical protein
VDFEIEEEFEITSRIIRKSYDTRLFGLRRTGSRLVKNLKSLFGTDKFTFNHDARFAQTADMFFNHIEQLLGMSDLIKKCNLITSTPTPVVKNVPDIGEPLRRARDNLYKKYLDDLIAISALTKTEADQMLAANTAGDGVTTPIPSNAGPWNQSNTRINSWQLRSDPPLSKPSADGGGGGVDCVPNDQGTQFDLFGTSSGGDYIVSQEQKHDCAIIYSTCMRQGLVVTGADISHVYVLVNNIADFKLVKQYTAALTTLQIADMTSYFNKRDFDSFEIIESKVKGFETLFDIEKVEIEEKRHNTCACYVSMFSANLSKEDGFGYNKQFPGYNGGADNLNDYESNYSPELIPIIPIGSYGDLNATASHVACSKAEITKKHVKDIKFAINLLFEINPNRTDEMIEPLKSNVIVTALCGCPWVDNDLDKLKLTNLTSTVLLNMGLNKKRKSDGIYYYNIIKRGHKPKYMSESAILQEEEEEVRCERLKNEKIYRGDLF